MNRSGIGALRAALLLSALMVSALANAMEESKPARMATSFIKRGAIVEAVNAETRELKLIDAGGNRFTIVAGEQVRNFAQINPRDRIIVEYMESMAVVIAPEGTPLPPAEETVLGVAAEGDKPGLEAATTRVVIATVHAINLADRSVTIETTDGEFSNVTVRDDAPLEMVEIGDQLRVRLTTAIAVSVEKPST